MNTEQAWEMAWRQLYGSAPGVTKRILKRHNKQTGKVGALVENHDGQRANASLALFTAPLEPVREQLPAGHWMIDPEAIGKILADPAHALRVDAARTSAKKIDKQSETPREDAAQGPHAARTPAKSSQVAPSYPPPAQGRQKATDKDARTQVRAARAAAADIARKATPEQAEADRKVARAWALEQLRADGELGWRDIQNHFAQDLPEGERLSRTDYGETWCRKQLTAAKDDLGRPLQMVA